MDNNNYNCSLYLVTDWSKNYPSRTLLQTIEEGILGGVTIVQLREKESSTEDFTKLTKEVLAITRKHNVPLIINDNLEVLEGSGADGLHVGQDDMPCSLARERLGPDKIIGVSVESPEQALKALADGANYIGIQSCFPTTTKTTEMPFLGHIGVREILEALPSPTDCPNFKTVGIGGLNQSNIQQLISKSKASNGRFLDGIAVISAIVAAPDAKSASSKLLAEVKNGQRDPKIENLNSINEILKSIPQKLIDLRKIRPLTHHITNTVVMNDCANCTLALGGSPIMSVDPREAEELAGIVDSLVLNIGTLTEPIVECMLVAGKYANAQSKPIIFDPVGAGATSLRRNTTRRILNSVHIDIIKGNAGEISTIAQIVGVEMDEETQVKMKGVDADTPMENPGKIVKAIAKRENCVVVMTGPIDYISDGTRTVQIENGHSYQGRITGSGCMVAGAIASFAGNCNAHFIAACAGVLCMNLAAEHAAKRPDVQGPGTFRAAFMDELANLDVDKMYSEFRFRILEED